MKFLYVPLATAMLFSSLFASDAQQIFEAKCAMCHTTTIPQDRSKLIAPPIMGVMRHVKMHHPNKEEAVNFIVDYTMNPSKKKAVCMPQKIQRFGLMPSLKGQISVKELKEVAGWLYDNFPPVNFKGSKESMQGKCKMNISK